MGGAPQHVTRNSGYLMQTTPHIQRAQAPMLDLEAKQFNELFPDFQGFILNLPSIYSMLLLQVKDIVCSGVGSCFLVWVHHLLVYYYDYYNYGNIFEQYYQQE